MWLATHHPASFSTLFVYSLFLSSCSKIYGLNGWYGCIRLLFRIPWICILIWFCRQLPQIKTLTFVGRNSICFYFMSGALPITLSAIIKRFYPEVSPWGVFLVFSLTLIGAYIASLVIVKYLPWMLDIRKLKKWWRRMFLWINHLVSLWWMTC